MPVSLLATLQLKKVSWEMMMIYVAHLKVHHIVEQLKPSHAPINAREGKTRKLSVTELEIYIICIPILQIPDCTVGGYGHSSN
jgi:hypothetical protein